VRICTFTGALTLTHNATSLILPGAASITTAAGDVAVFVSEGGGNWRCVSYTKANGLSLALSSELYRGHKQGLTLSNNSVDATNDIDIAAGSAGSDGATPVLMTLSSAITKRLDAAWAVGSGNGGLDTGAIANGTYHVWLIRRSDTGVVDALFSASATSPTMPANYDQKARIGSILRESAAIVPFIQTGRNRFERKTGAQDRNSTAALASSLITLSVPTGINVRPILMSNVSGNSAAAHTISNSIGSAATGSADLTFQQIIGPTGVITTDRTVLEGLAQTNTSAQVYYAVTLTTGTPTSNILLTKGWYDDGI